MGLCDDCNVKDCSDCSINLNGWKDRPKRRVTFLTGIPKCPDCNTVLELRIMPQEKETRWYCPNKECGTQWEVRDLVQAINDNLDLEEGVT